MEEYKVEKEQELRLPPVVQVDSTEYLIQKMRAYYDFEKHQPRPVVGELEL